MANIILINEQQLKDVANLAHEIWPQAYSQIISQAQISYMLEMMYSIENLQKQYNSGHHFIGIYHNTHLIAFASYQIFNDSKKIKIHKLYVHPAMQGQGFGILLFKNIYNIGLANNCNTLILNVNKYNKALYFYKKLNMHIANEEIIDIGNGYIMDDYVMEIIIENKN
jgi:diamine N-acetyltransferase